MDELKFLITSEGLKTLPFIKSVIIYFLQFFFILESIVWTTILKCAPIFCLMIFILLYGIKFTKAYRYNHLILMGLIFSSIGDALLNVNLFAFGMIGFGVAQCFYAAAFGYKNYKWWIGIILIIPAIVLLALIIPRIDDVILMVGLPIYSFLLLNMSWRAIARIDRSKDYLYVTKICCGIGSILFVASDAMIAIDKFYTPIPYRTIWIMVTYYIAQFTIAVSIARYPNDEKLVVQENSTEKSIQSVGENSLVNNKNDQNATAIIRQRKHENEGTNSF